MSREGLKYMHLGEKITTAPFQFKILLDTNNSVAVDSEKDLINPKKVWGFLMLQKFDYFWGLPEAHIPKPLGDIISYWILLFFFKPCLF